MTDEVVLLRLRPHARVLLRPVVALVAVCGLVGFAAAALPVPLLVVALVAGLLLVRLSLVPWLRWLTTTFVLTDRRVRLRSGLLRTTTREVALRRVTDVVVHRTVRQRLFGSGTLVLCTDAGTVAVRDLPHVAQVATEVADLLDERTTTPARA